MFKKISLEAIEKILKGEKQPSNIHEDFFLMAFHNAIEGLSFHQSYIEFSAICDIEDAELVNAFCIGFALGEQNKDEFSDKLSDIKH